MNVQDDNGSVVDANAYIDVVFFKQHHDDRGNDYSAFSDTQIESAIIKATDFLDIRFMFVGDRLKGRDQTTEWPRCGAYDRDDYYVNGIPLEVKKATAEYALRALTAPLNPDPTGGDGSQKTIQSTSKKVGPLSKQVVYVESAREKLPDYPAADKILKLAGLVERGGRIVRA